MSHAVHAPGPASAQAGALRGYWPPFAAMHTRAEQELIIVRGQGCRVWDRQGTEYLDATASLWYANVGHGRHEIAEAAAAQLKQLAAFSNFGSFATEPTLRLAERITAMAPMDDPLVFLTSGGSDAVDSAVKIARHYWTLQGRPEKVGMISRQRAYHGMHGFGTALAGIEANAAGYGTDTTGGFLHAPDNDLDAMRAVIERIGPDRLGAVFAEPVIGAGGVVPPADGYLAGLRELCDEFDLLLVADEVITGFGRLGNWFACERFGIRPDLLLFAKGVTSGYLPLGGVVASRRVWQPVHDSGATFRHGYTYSGHAAACAAALANLDIITDEGLLGRVSALEPTLGRAVTPLAAHRLVQEVRNIGLLAAVQLHTSDTAIVERVVTACRERGVLTRALSGGAVQVSPPFVVTEAQIARIARVLGEALDDVSTAIR